MSIGDIYPTKWSKIKDLMAKRTAPKGVTPKHMKAIRRQEESQNDGTIAFMCINFEHVPHYYQY